MTWIWSRSVVWICWSRSLDQKLQAVQALMKVFDVCKDMQESQLRTCHNMPVCLCVGFFWSWEISKADTNKKGNLEFVCFLFSGFAIFSLHFAWFVPIIPLFSSFCFQNFLLFSCIMYGSFCLYGFPFFSCFSLRQSKGKTEIIQKWEQ